MIAPSLLSADFAFLQKEIDMVNLSDADWFHLDIMDGVFVPNLSFGLPVVKAIKRHAIKPLDVHLMIVEPDKYVEAFADAGADWLTVHYEACIHLHRLVSKIRKMGMKAGVALNPHTPVSSLSEIIKDIDLLLIMSVNPGFGGQSFIENSYRKIEQAAELIVSAGSDCLIEVDGGVDRNNVAKLVESGVNVLVAGNSVFKSPDPAGEIKILKNT